MTRDRDTAAKLLAEEYGDPLEDMLVKRARWQATYDEQIAKPSRRRNVKKLAEAEQRIREYNNDIMPFMRPKYQAINHTGDAAPVPTVIRAPESISDSKSWLEKHAPKRDDAVNERPQIASPALQKEVHRIELEDAEERLADLNRRMGNA